MHLRCWWLSRDQRENSARSQHGGVLIIYLPSHIYYADSSEHYGRSVTSIKTSRLRNRKTGRRADSFISLRRAQESRFRDWLLLAIATTCFSCLPHTLRLLLISIPVVLANLVGGAQWVFFHASSNVQVNVVEGLTLTSSCKGDIDDNTLANLLILLCAGSEV